MLRVENALSEIERTAMNNRNPHSRLPESLLWLSNELYWKQNLAPPTVCGTGELARIAEPTPSPT
jgi:hypothetical protein